jgi:hypothetical protein
MHEPLETAEIPLPLSMVVRIDQICDRFEAAWNTVAPGGPGPQIDDYLGDIPEPERGAVLRHLVALDLDYRRRNGETPLPSDYQRRYPGLSDRLLADLLTLPASGSSVAPAAEEKAAAAPLGTAAANPVLDLSTIDLPPPSAPLLRSNRYVIRQFHARGGTSEIWLALDAEIGRQVAVKKLDKKHATDQDRFLVEAQVTGQLEHPGIVPVHDLGRDKQGRPFYVMTFIQGRKVVHGRGHRGPALPPAGGFRPGLPGGRLRPQPRRHPSRFEAQQRHARPLRRDPGARLGHGQGTQQA